MLQQNAEYSPAGETKDEGHVLRPPSLTFQTRRKQRGSGPTVQYRSGARPSVGGKTACWDPMWHLAPSRTTRSENNLLGGQTPVFLSDVTEPGFRTGLTGFHGNRIPLLMKMKLALFGSSSFYRRRPRVPRCHRPGAHLACLVTDPLR